METRKGYSVDSPDARDHVGAVRSTCIEHVPGSVFAADPSESERVSLRFQARREHKVNPIARSTLITLLSLIVRKSRRIDRRCKTLIEGLWRISRDFFSSFLWKVFSI